MQEGAIRANEPRGLPLEFRILPQYLSPLGYFTHAVGKWHLGHHRRAYTPTQRGFHSFLGYLTGKEDYYTRTNSGLVRELVKCSAFRITIQ